MSNKKNEKRNPVVVVLGHVDHGKSTLLESLGNFNITQNEAGGITQHVTAWEIKIDNDHLMTFIDTPGHEAYSNIRSRGAEVTDIGVLVVAADDGVKPQTKEAVKYLLEAKVPVLVVVNKIDRVQKSEEKNVLEKIKTELSSLGLTPEDWGGNTIFIKVSAKEKTGLTELKETLSLMADVQDLKVNKKENLGIVLESYKDGKQGKKNLILIKNGTVHLGDYLITKEGNEKLKQILSFDNLPLKKVITSEPVNLISLKNNLSAGEYVYFTKDEKNIPRLENEVKEINEITFKPIEIDKLNENEKEKSLKIVFRVDTFSNQEVINEEVKKINKKQEKISDVRERIKILPISFGVGEITDSDILLADSMKADLIIGFNIKIEKETQKLAKKEEIEIKNYSIIYKMFDDLKRFAKEKHKARKEALYFGKMDVLKIFRIDKKEVLVGGKVIEGKVKTGVKYLVRRGLEKMGQGKVKTIHLMKDQVNEITEGKECGLVLVGSRDFKEGDRIEFLK